MLFKLHKQKGAMLITVLFLLITFVGFSALAVDVGRVLFIRNELQNGADAAALAGANCLNRTTASSGTDCIDTISSTLNFETAKTKATNSIALNNSDNVKLIDGSVKVGYWNINGGTALQLPSLSPLGPCTKVGMIMTTPCDKPAVMVTLSKSDNNNSGAVKTLTASMFGGKAVPISATAVAVLSSPGTVLQNSLIPIAISQCMFEKYWNSATNEPKLATTTNLSYTDERGRTFLIPQTIGQPWVFRIGSAYHYDTCQSGQWTSFDKNLNSASAIRALVNNGNPTQLAIGDNTWVVPGTQATNYGDLDDKYPTPGSVPPLSPVNDVTVAVLSAATDLTNKGLAPIVAFAGFHIIDVQKSPEKYIEGNFVKSTITPGASGIGPSYGTYTPPRLAQ